MLSLATKKDRTLFLSAVKKLFGSMGLKVLEHGLDYSTEKPDAVAIYENKKKYYVIEALSLQCFDSPSPRLYSKDASQFYRAYCKKLFADNEEEASIAAAVVCDLSSGLEVFSYKVVGGHVLNDMSRYGALVMPQEKTPIVSSVLEKLGIDFRTLDILDEFTLALISKDDTEKLAEKKKFIGFLLSNR
ncbi:MAG: hypothetical protein IJD28_00565 [Deferribacterales bacterium]|nr:hypothetical protein [Deferribacterales bacterium]